LRKQIESVQKQIVSLQKKIKAEKQFTRQIELNAEVKSLRRFLNELHLRLIGHK